MNGRWKAKSGRRMPAFLLGAYFILLPLDCFSIGAVGSFLRLFAIFPVIAVFVSGGFRRLYLNRTSAWLLAFAAMAVISFIWTVNSERTLAALKTFSLNAMLVLVTGACFEYTTQEVKGLKCALIAGSWLMAVLMLVSGEIAEGRLILKLGENVQDANYANGFMMFAISHHMNALIKRRWKHILPLAFLMGMVFATGSRGGVVACAGCAGINLVLAAKNGWKGTFVPALMILAGCCACLAAAALLWEDMLQRFSASYLLEYGSTGRLDIWRHLAAVFEESGIFRQIFGYGYGTTTHLTALSEIPGVQGKVAHNLYMDMLLNLGAAGLVVFAGMHMSGLKSLLRHGDNMLAAAYGAFLIMCLSLSLISYKPIWALMTYALAEDIQMSNMNPEECGAWAGTCRKRDKATGTITAEWNDS